MSENGHANGQEEALHAAEAASTLVLRRVAIDTYRENVAYLHRDCELYRAEGFQALAKVEVSNGGRRILASVNVVDDDSIVGCLELGLSEDAFALLGLPEGHRVSVSQAEPPSSIPALHRKIAGERLRAEDFRAIVNDIAEHRYSKIELTAFIVACNQAELDREEVFFLSDAMSRVGRRLNWGEQPVVDKHCIGGATRQPHIHVGGADCGSARHVMPENLIPRHHLAGRYSRYHGSAGARGTAIRPAQ